MNKPNIYSPEMKIRILASGAIGNILETYDLILISLMMAQLKYKEWLTMLLAHKSQYGFFARGEKVLFYL